MLISRAWSWRTQARRQDLTGEVFTGWIGRWISCKQWEAEVGWAVDMDD
jgi:hypothetical protein